MPIETKTPKPSHLLPIVVIGAGGIVADAHLPAYKKAGFEVFAIVNRTKEKAAALAATFGIEHVFSQVSDAVLAAPGKVVYDIAVMPAQYMEILEQLPDESIVLIQKPMGETIRQAREILEICRKKKLIAAINFQLRFAPFINAARSVIEQGLIGEIYDMEVRVTTYTPWEIFPYVAVNKRLEILYHSIHYMDLIRSFLGTPESLISKTFRHPLKTFSSTRTTTVLDYGDTLRAVINTNHDHHFGSAQQESFIKWEGTKGAIKIKMGLLLNYPQGTSDSFEYCILTPGKEPEWQTLPVKGSWFPDAFMNIMYALMSYCEGSTKSLPNSVEDVIHTMEMVENAYCSDAKDGFHTCT